MTYQSFSEYRGSEQFKIDQKDVANIKKKEEQRKNDIEASYSDTGGLPANLRYPYAMIDSGMDFLKSALNKYVLGERYTNPNYVSPMKFQSGTGFGFMTPENQAPGLIKIGEGISKRDPRMDELGIDEYAKKVKYSPGMEKFIDESDIGNIQLNQIVEFSTDAFPDRKLNATISQIRYSPIDDQNVITYEVIATTLWFMNLLENSLM